MSDFLKRVGSAKSTLEDKNRDLWLKHDEKAAICNQMAARLVNDTSSLKSKYYCDVDVTEAQTSTVLKINHTLPSEEAVAARVKFEFATEIMVKRSLFTSQTAAIKWYVLEIAFLTWGMAPEQGLIELNDYPMSMASHEGNKKLRGDRGHLFQRAGVTSHILYSYEDMLSAVALGVVVVEQEFKGILRL